MSDRLTQLQNCLDQLLKQMYLSIQYLSNRAPLSRPQGQPYLVNEEHRYHDTPAHLIPKTKDLATDPDAPPAPDASALEDERPDSPATFKAAMEELAHDLVAKQQQIEYLIRSLPGMGSTRGEQEERIRQLEGELGAMDVELREAALVKERLVARVEGMLGQVRRV